MGTGELPVKMIEGLKTWWQRQTGEEETPFDGDSPAFIASLLVHLGILLILGFIPLVIRDNQISLTVSIPTPEEKVELKIPEEFYFSENPAEEVGANSVNGEAVALSVAPTISEISAIPSHMEMTTPVDNAQIEINNMIEVATGLNYNANLAVKGAAGEGTTGAAGAIDRITHEILLSLEERKTLVVWLFDGTASLVPQRRAIHDRFQRIYEELGIIEAAGKGAFAKYDEKPLLSSVISFGTGVQLMTKKPTDNVEDLKKAVAEIKNDDSGTENVFSAVYEAAKLYAEYRYTSSDEAKPDRNVMLVVFTDEAGSDQTRMEDSIKMCRRWAMPVYVIGVPAPFGKRETMMKWVNPDPKFDQTAGWGVVEQGPESLRPERIKLGFSGSKETDDAMDSGFGPFALTRLCYETGGIYFAVHPNRDTRKAVSRNDTEAYSGYLKYFFDPEVMRRYRPDYLSLNEYDKRVSQNKARWALVSAASNPQLEQMENAKTKFVKSDEAKFAADLSDAQQAAARLDPKVNALYEPLRLGEADRDKETVLRWEAGYDLAMGRTMAVKVRTESYNAMLAAAKRGLKFKDPKNNTWILQPDDEISVGSQMAKMAERAKMYLERVAKEHAGTPWALLAERELKDPLGWKWTEDYTDLAPKPKNNAAAAAAAPANDKRMMLAKPKPKAPVPKL
jgi:hypothetical protein